LDQIGAQCNRRRIGIYLILYLSSVSFDRGRFVIENVLCGSHEKQKTYSAGINSLKLNSHIEDSTLWARI